MSNVQYDGYPVHVLHVPKFWANRGPLVSTTPNNRATNLLFNALTGLC